MGVGEDSATLTTGGSTREVSTDEGKMRDIGREKSRLAAEREDLLRTQVYSATHPIIVQLEQQLAALVSH